jgi:NAD(P)-dependent dehydrogenase (short-subunit alcohol dehydrogenase family)
MRLKDKVAIVTGSAGGIGRATAIRLAAEGAHVAVADVDTAGAEQTAAAITGNGGRAMSTSVDVTDPTQVAKMVEETVEAFGGLDILVNNAAILGRTRVLEVTEEVWDQYMAVNLKGVFLCSQATVRWWLEHDVRGAIVNLASVESSAPFPHQIAYATTKGGVLMMTRALALDLAPHGIRVNAVGPGTVDSRGYFARHPDKQQKYEALHPLGRLGQPEDVANAILFLASDEADWITGEILYVDGGFLVRG